VVCGGEGGQLGTLCAFLLFYGFVRLSVSLLMRALLPGWMPRRKLCIVEPLHSNRSTREKRRRRRQLNIIIFFVLCSLRCGVLRTAELFKSHRRVQ
jgi:hypothetical protein